MQQPEDFIERQVMHVLRETLRHDVIPESKLLGEVDSLAMLEIQQRLEEAMDQPDLFDAVELDDLQSPQTLSAYISRTVKAGVQKAPR